MAPGKQHYDMEEVAHLKSEGLSWPEICKAVGYPHKPKSLATKYNAEYIVKPTPGLSPAKNEDRLPDFSGQNVTPSASDGRVVRSQPVAEPTGVRSSMGWV